MKPLDQSLRQKAYPFYNYHIDMIMAYFSRMKSSKREVLVPMPLANGCSSSNYLNRLRGPLVIDNQSMMSHSSTIQSVDLDTVTIEDFEAVIMNGPPLLAKEFKDRRSWFARLVFVDRDFRTDEWWDIVREPKGFDVGSSDSSKRHDLCLFSLRCFALLMCQGSNEEKAQHLFDMLIDYEQPRSIKQEIEIDNGRLVIALHKFKHFATIFPFQNKPNRDR